MWRFSCQAYCWPFHRWFRIVHPCIHCTKKWCIFSNSEFEACSKISCKTSDILNTQMATFATWTSCSIYPSCAVSGNSKSDAYPPGVAISCRSMKTLSKILLSETLKFIPKLRMAIVTARTGNGLEFRCFLPSLRLHPCSVMTGLVGIHKRWTISAFWKKSLRHPLVLKICS